MGCSTRSRERGLSSIEMHQKSLTPSTVSQRPMEQRAVLTTVFAWPPNQDTADKRVSSRPTRWRMNCAFRETPLANITRAVLPHRDLLTSRSWADVPPCSRLASGTLSLLRCEVLTRPVWRIVVYSQHAIETLSDASYNLTT